MSGKTQIELFLELAQPDEHGYSRWVSVEEFVGAYSGLVFGNGASWARRSSTLQRKYKVEFDRSVTKGNSIDRLRLQGFNQELHFKQTIRADIRQHYQGQRCVMLGVVGQSENTKIEIDHKDGRKNDERVSDTSRQTIDDFQPLCKAANDVKRQACKECRRTNKRWNAKNLKGNPYSFYIGGEEYTEDLGCKGCYMYDPVAYRLESVRLIGEEASNLAVELVMKKLYPEELGDR